MHRTYSSRLCFTNRHIFVYIAGIRKQLLFHCPRIHTLHLYLKHPRCTSQPMDSNEMTWLLLPTSWKPWTPIVHIVPSMVPPRMYGIHRECLHPWISLGTLLSWPLLSLLSLRGPLPSSALTSGTLPWPVLFAAVGTCGPCFPKPHSCLWPGPFPKDFCLAKVQLIHPGHHQCYQSAQDRDSFTLL